MPSPLKYIVFSLWKNVSVGHAPNGACRLAAGRRAHRSQHVLVGDDERLRHDAFDGALADLSGEVAGDQLRARGGDAEVAAGELRMRVRVDDVADRTVAGERAYCGEELIGHPVGHRVHDEHTLCPACTITFRLRALIERYLAVHRQSLECLACAGASGEASWTERRA